MVEVWLQAAEGMPTSVGAGRPKLIACVLKWFQAGLLRTAPANPCVPLLLCLNYLLVLQHSQRTFAPVQYSINLIMDQNHMPCTLLNTDPPLYFVSNVIFVRPVSWNITVVPTCSPAVDKNSSVSSACTKAGAAITFMFCPTQALSLLSQTWKQNSCVELPIHRAHNLHKKDITSYNTGNWGMQSEIWLSLSYTDQLREEILLGANAFLHGCCCAFNIFIYSAINESFNKGGKRWEKKILHNSPWSS